MADTSEYLPAETIGCVLYSRLASVDQSSLIQTRVAVRPDQPAFKSTNYSVSPDLLEQEKNIKTLARYARNCFY
jgi:hypothetical protein